MAGFFLGFLLTPKIGCTVDSNSTLRKPVLFVLTTYECRTSLPFSLSQKYLQENGSRPLVYFIASGIPLRLDCNVPTHVMFCSSNHVANGTLV